MNTIIDPVYNIEYPITSKIGRNILKKYLINYKNGGQEEDFSILDIHPVTVWCGKVKGAVVCSEKNPFPDQSNSNEAMKIIDGLPSNPEDMDKLIQAVKDGEIE